ARPRAIDAAPVAVRQQPSRADGLRQDRVGDAPAALTLDDVRHRHLREDDKDVLGEHRLLGGLVHRVVSVRGAAETAGRGVVGVGGCVLVAVTLDVLALRASLTLRRREAEPGAGRARGKSAVDGLVVLW